MSSSAPPAKSPPIPPTWADRAQLDHPAWSSYLWHMRERDQFPSLPLWELWAAAWDAGFDAKSEADFAPKLADTSQHLTEVEGAS